MDTSTAPLSRVRSNRALISAVRHRSHYMRETATASDLSLLPLQGEEEEDGDDVKIDEKAVEHTESTVVNTTAMGGATGTDAAPAAINPSEARRNEGAGGSVSRPTRTRPTFTRLAGIAKRERTASLSSSSSASSLTSSSPDEATTHAPPADTSSDQLKDRLRKSPRFDNNEDEGTATKTTVVWTSPSSTIQQQQSRLLKKRSKRRRTETSYDEDTTNYLKRVFFEVYGHGRKLNKVERRAVEAATGLMSRKITYWFSNQKRRFTAELKAFQRLSSQGCIKTYDDFLVWCKENYVPELVSMPQQEGNEEQQPNSVCMNGSTISLQGKEIVTLTRSS